jgi:hypothetical protein
VLEDVGQIQPGMNRERLAHFLPEHQIGQLHEFLLHNLKSEFGAPRILILRRNSSCYLIAEAIFIASDRHDLVMYLWEGANSRRQAGGGTCTLLFFHSRCSLVAGMLPITVPFSPFIFTQTISENTG